MAHAPRHERHGAALWLAIGVLVTRWVPPFRRQSARPLGIEWRYVSTRRDRASDARFVIVDCPDVFFSNATRLGMGAKIQMGFQFSCFCKTAQWFRRALVLFPNARFVGKMEDDSVLHDARVPFACAAPRRPCTRATPFLPSFGRRTS